MTKIFNFQFSIFKYFRSKRAFSLLELLIVITIIGILVALGTVSYSQAQRKARDSRRQSDMKAMQNAFEQYYGNNNSTYPASAALLVPTYLPSGVPTDPKTGAVYVPTFPAGGYCVCATLEGTTTGGNATNGSCSYGSGGFYCVSNLQ